MDISSAHSPERRSTTGTHVGDAVPFFHTTQRKPYHHVSSGTTLPSRKNTKQEARTMLVVHIASRVSRQPVDTCIFTMRAKVDNKLNKLVNKTSAIVEVGTEDGVSFKKAGKRSRPQLLFLQSSGTFAPFVILWRATATTRSICVHRVAVAL